MSNTLLGIFFVICGGAIINFGVVLQKRQINIRTKQQLPLEPNITQNDLKSYFKDPLWILGILMQTILSLPFIFLGLDYLGPSLAQPLSNACIIFLVLGLIFVLKESIKRIEIIGIVILILGMIAIGLGGVTGIITLSAFLEEKVTIFWIFMFIVTVFVVGFFILSKNKKFFLISYGLLIGLFYSIVTISMQLFLLSFEDLSLSIAKLMLIGGVLGLILATIIAVILSQNAFKRGQAINIIPFSQITMNLVPIIAGIIIFEQIVTNTLVFWIGTLLIIVGASFLARFQN
jgi:drug/metabolite transporter (DMT)-like permease